MNRLRKLKDQLRQVYPSKLPITVDELNLMIKDVLLANDLPDNPSYHHAIATAIMHLDPLTTRKQKRFFAKSVRKSISNQVAFDKMQLLKQEAIAQDELSKQTPLTETDEGLSHPQG